MSSESETTEIDLVTIRTFPSDLEANIAKGALKAFGIDCMLTRDDCGGQRPHLTLTGGPRLLVRSDDAQRAAEVLNSQGEPPE
jgi:Putative prokaryotic signal transducing protein